MKKFIDIVGIVLITFALLGGAYGIEYYQNNCMENYENSGSFTCEYGQCIAMDDCIQCDMCSDGTDYCKKHTYKNNSIFK